MTREKWPQPQVIGHALAAEAWSALGNRASAQTELSLSEKIADANKDATQGVRFHADIVAAELKLNTPAAPQGKRELADLENRFAAAKSPDEWNQNLFAMARIARIAENAEAWPLVRSTADHMIAMDPYYAGGYLARAAAERQARDTSSAARDQAHARRLWSHPTADPARERPAE